MITQIYLRLSLKYLHIVLLQIVARKLIKLGEDVF